ncbi:hypothetical protein EBR11_07935 [bacterium]|nr:hypothetical protein [bacterium]
MGRIGGLVGEWTRGLVGEGDARCSAKVQKCKGGKVGASEARQWISGRVGEWNGRERERQEAV